MAQYDTGLGWSAKEEWLINTGPTKIGTMSVAGGPDYPGQPIPYAATAAGGATNGMYICEFQTPYVSHRTYYAYTKTDGAVCLFALMNYGSGYGTLAISTTPNAVVSIAAVITSTGEIVDNPVTLTNLDTATGLYYLPLMPINLDYASNLNPNVPIFTSQRDAFDAVTLATQDYYKLNPGYAVACFPSWYTLAGNRITSPVLISSEKNAVTLSLDGSTVAPSYITENIAYNGKIFYMSYMLSEEGRASGTVPIVDLTQFAAATAKKVFSLLAASSYANILITGEPPDPYEEETGPSEEDGGAGSDPEDSPVEEETLPLPAVVGLGFSTIYVPTQADLHALAAYMWGGNLDLENFLKLFANPMDSILGLSAVPLSLAGNYEPIYLGGQLIQGVTMPRYTGRTAVKVDMGTATIEERWGAYLDYDPYTELAIYVPFVGIKNIKADDVMGKTVRLMYNIDILSGACVAYLRPEGGSVMYEWSGQCAVQIPITGANWDNIFSTAINTVATLGGAMFAPAAAPVLGGAVASAAVQAVAAKPRIERSGAVNGITGFLGQLRPYILRTIPEAYIPGDQNKYIGYPSYVSVSLGSLSGYNEIASVHLENIPATGDELAELESILKGGVIF